MKLEKTFRAVAEAFSSQFMHMLLKSWYSEKIMAAESEKQLFLIRFKKKLQKRRKVSDCPKNVHFSTFPSDLCLKREISRNLKVQLFAYQDNKNWFPAEGKTKMSKTTHLYQISIIPCKEFGSVQKKTYIVKFAVVVKLDQEKRSNSQRIVVHLFILFSFLETIAFRFKNRQSKVKLNGLLLFQKCNSKEERCPRVLGFTSKSRFYGKDEA